MGRVISFCVFFALAKVGWSQPFGTDESFNQKYSAHNEACSNAVNIPFGGAGNSKFETFTCEQLIREFSNQEQDGRSKKRISDFMTFDACKKEFISPNLADRLLKRARNAGKKQSDWVSCAKGVQSILDYMKDQKDFFIKSLQFKVETYDSLYVVNRSLMIPSGTADNKNCEQIPSARDFQRTGRYAGLNDCHWIARGAPRCVLKLGEQTNRNLYADAQASRWTDRQKCKSYIDKNTEMYEAFATGLRKEITESAQENLNAAPTVSNIDCSKYDPNRQLTYKDSWGPLGMLNADAMLKCASNVIGSPNPTTSGESNPGVGSGR